MGAEKFSKFVTNLNKSIDVANEILWGDSKSSDSKSSDSKSSDSKSNGNSRTACPKSVREALWRSYFGNRMSGKCYVCQCKIDFTNFEAGHNKPASHGGEWSLRNLRPLCRSCNRSMGNKMSVEEYKRKYFK